MNDNVGHFVAGIVLAVIPAFALGIAAVALFLWLHRVKD